MREWYWTKKARSADVGIHQTLRRLGLIKYYAHEDNALTIPELIHRSLFARTQTKIHFVWPHKNTYHKYFLFLTQYDGFQVSLYFYFFYISYVV